MLVRQEAFARAGGFPEAAEVTYEDHALLRQLTIDGCRWHLVCQHTWTYRFGDWDGRSKQVWRGER